MQVLEFSVMYSIEMFFREPIAVVLFIATMTTLSPQLTLISLLLLPVSGLIIARISRTLKRRNHPLSVIRVTSYPLLAPPPTDDTRLLMHSLVSKAFTG
jgi:ABC-type bacteriocin/lantibiotic exporter with double-glycine peptidase domain